VKIKGNIQSSDSRVRAPESYSAPAQPAAENEVADFIAALVKLVKPQRVLELGTAFGHTSEKIGQALADNGFGELDTLDIKANRLEEARKRVAGLPVNVHEADYTKWTPPDGAKYDLAFFDSDRRNRDREYALFKPYLNPYAVLLFHDVGDNHPATQPAIQRLPLDKVFLLCPRGLMIASELPAR